MSLQTLVQTVNHFENLLVLGRGKNLEIKKISNRKEAYKNHKLRKSRLKIKKYKNKFAFDVYVVIDCV